MSTSIYDFYIDDAIDDFDANPFEWDSRPAREKIARKKPHQNGQSTYDQDRLKRHHQRSNRHTTDEF